MILSNLSILSILMVCSWSLKYGSKRPFFNIGKSANSLPKVDTFLKNGSNALEFDVYFHKNGSVHGVRHGYPCDFGRVCIKTTNMTEYLKYVRNLTNPCINNGYNKQLVMLFFDLKLRPSENKTKSGKDVLRHIVDNLWSCDESRKQEVKVLLYIQHTFNRDFILGFLDELQNLGLEHRLKDVGFDGGDENMNRTRNMFQSLNVSVNVWQGIRKRAIHVDKRLWRLVSVRDSQDNSMQKVYDWTEDNKAIMRIYLRLGVDGIITNKPKILAEVLGEPEFKGGFRLATIEDDPFALFEDDILTKTLDVPKTLAVPKALDFPKTLAVPKTLPYEHKNAWLWMRADDLGKPELDAWFRNYTIEDDPSTVFEDGIPTYVSKADVLGES